MVTSSLEARCLSVWPKLASILTSLNVSFSTINGGWTPQGLVTAVSMMHESGTGGFPKYGIIPQMPLTTIDAPVNILDNRTYWQQRVGDDTARVGYYQDAVTERRGCRASSSRHAESCSTASLRAISMCSSISPTISRMRAEDTACKCSLAVR